MVEGDLHAAVEGRARRADAGGAVGAEEDVAVAVAPEGDVDREERGDQSLVGGEVQLVLTHRLGVDDDGAQFGSRALGADGADGLDEHVDGAVTVAVGKQRDAGLVAGAQPGGHLLLGHVRVAAVVAGGIGFRVVVVVMLASGQVAGADDHLGAGLDRNRSRGACHCHPVGRGRAG